MYNKEMYKDLCEEFRRLEGQPVKIFGDDEKSYCGIVLYATEYAVRILSKCGDVFMVEYPHIAAVEEPQMRLRCCRPCDRKCRDYDDDNYYNGEDNGEDCDCDDRYNGGRYEGYRR